MFDLSVFELLVEKNPRRQVKKKKKKKVKKVPTKASYRCFNIYRSVRGRGCPCKI